MTVQEQDILRDAIAFGPKEVDRLVAFFESRDRMNAAVHGDPTAVRWSGITTSARILREQIRVLIDSRDPASLQYLTNPSRPDYEAAT